jgi:molecular chaperone GrpE (heat shock protein)
VVGGGGDTPLRFWIWHAAYLCWRSGFGKGLLDVADNMSRAIDATHKLPVDQLESNAPLKSMLEGIVMTQGQLLATLAKHGIVKARSLDGGVA